MSPRKITAAYTCEVCNRPTSRLYGLAGAVALADTGAVSMRSAVLGYCAAHREAVACGFAEALASEGTVEWIAEPPAELRPGDVDAFLAQVDAMMAASAEEHGLLPSGSTYEVNRGAPPESCPHCGGHLSWGTGPHIQGAARRPGAQAWECPSCHAAGMLTTLPA